MKKIISLAVITVMVFSLTGPVHADNAIKKLGRGLANVATCPFELFSGMETARQDNGIFAAATWGILLGTFNVVKRAVVGVYEVATFPIPLPAHYAPILEKPEFFLEKKQNDSFNF